MAKKIDGIKTKRDIKARKGIKNSNFELEISDDKKQYSRKLVLESIGELPHKKSSLISDIKPRSKEEKTQISKKIKKKKFFLENKIMKKKSLKQKEIADNFISEEAVQENIEIEKEEEEMKNSKNKSFDSVFLKNKNLKKKKEELKKQEDDVLRKQIDLKLAEAKEENLSFDDLIDYKKKSDVERIINKEIEEKTKKIKKPEKFIEKKDKKTIKDLEKKKKKEEKEKKINLKNARKKEKEALFKKRKKEIKNKIIQFKKNFYNFKHSFLSSIKNYFQKAIIFLKKRFLKFIISFSLLFLIFIIIYLSLFIAIIKFNIDNKFTRSLADFVPFPAFFIDSNFVAYYDYVDIKKEFEKDNLKGDVLKNAVRKEVISQLILSLLEKRYHFLINKELLNQDSFKRKISIRMMRDEEINTVSLNRIRKIKEMIQGEDFIKIASKYGDSLGKVSIDEKNKKDYFYADKVMKLENGDLSEIIYGENGYYIFKCFRKRDNVSDLSYVFIKGIDFNDYFQNALSSFQMMSLVD